MHFDLALCVEDANIHFTCMQIDPTVVLALLILKSHGLASFGRCGCGIVGLPFGTATEHVTYIATDFNVDCLEECLLKHKYDPSVKTFFLWEGVVMYLPIESVKRTLSLIAQAAPGSSVAFDYIYSSSLARPCDFIGAEPYFRIVKHRNEPCRFGLDPEDVEPFLKEHGLSILLNIGPKELSRLVPPKSLCDFLGIVHAKLRTTAPIL